MNIKDAGLTISNFNQEPENTPRQVGHLVLYSCKESVLSHKQR